LAAAASGLVVAAATLFVAPGSSSAATVSSVRSWSAGTLTPGQAKSYVWNNANSDIYQVNASGTQVGSVDQPCQVSVTDQYYTRSASGARKFRLTIKNTGTVSCNSTVYLAIVNADRSGSTATIAPGQSRTTHWNNANLANRVHFIGVIPDTPDEGTCQLSVKWKVRVTPSGENEFWWTVTNIGSVSCGGTWALGWLPVDNRTTFPETDEPADPGLNRWLITPISNPFRVYLFNPIPTATSAGNCDWGPTSHAQWGDPAVPTLGTKTEFGYVNVGSVPCVLHGVYVAYIA
jgi:hypothetical protein